MEQLDGRGGEMAEKRPQTFANHTDQKAIKRMVRDWQADHLRA
jgi:hypothetical protein